MKPYGYIKTGKTKRWDLGFEDVEAIQMAGRKSCIGKFPEKSGKYKSYTRNTFTRNKRRRYFKRLERRNNKGMYLDENSE